jgi:hypothetical protein
MSRFRAVENGRWVVHFQILGMPSRMESSLSDVDAGESMDTCGGLGSSNRARDLGERPDTSFRITRSREVPAASSHPGARLAFEMDAAIWTAIGLLAATSIGSLFYLGSRIDGVGSRIDGLGGRIDSLDSRIDGLSNRIDGLGGRIDALGARLDARLDGMESRIDAHLERHAAE